MSDVTRITHGAAAGAEATMSADVAMVDMARMFLASQARAGVPRVALSTDGRITLTWSDGQKVSYLTGVDTSSVPMRKV
jgi:hypothetical protein